MDIDIYGVKEVDDTYSIFIKINNYFNKEKLDEIKQNLEEIKFWYEGSSYGKPIARTQRWYCLTNKSFAPFWYKHYSRWNNNKYEDWLTELQDHLQKNLDIILKDYYKKYPDIKKIDFNSVLINKYKNKNEFIAAHRDSEKIFKDNPTIVSLSIGESRDFVLQRVQYSKYNPKNMKLNKKEKSLNKTFRLDNGTILIMAGSSQKYFSHQILKGETDGIRYNFTFRNHDPG
jgi:alkylated DNA repair dioxygenase AlkB